MKPSDVRAVLLAGLIPKGVLDEPGPRLLVTIEAAGDPRDARELRI